MSNNVINMNPRYKPSADESQRAFNRVRKQAQAILANLPEDDPDRPALEKILRGDLQTENLEQAHECDGSDT